MKYNEEQLNFIYQEGMDLINKFNYQHVFGVKSDDDPEMYQSHFINQWNEQAIEKSIFVTQ